MFSLQLPADKRDSKHYRQVTPVTSLKEYISSKSNLTDKICCHLITAGKQSKPISVTAKTFTIKKKKKKSGLREGSAVGVHIALLDSSGTSTQVCKPKHIHIIKVNLKASRIIGTSHQTQLGELFLKSRYLLSQAAEKQTTHPASAIDL